MTEQDWLASDDPAALLGALRNHGLQAADGKLILTALPSDRKLRLFACACRRMVPHLPWDGGSGGWQEMEDHPEREVLANGVGPHKIPAIEHAELFLRSREKPSRAEMAALLREIVGNPFRPLDLDEIDCPDCQGGGEVYGNYFAEDGMERCLLCRGRGVVAWECPWFTPIVFRIATAIYADRDWGALPVLADALEEAGCALERGPVRVVIYGTSGGHSYEVVARPVEPPVDEVLHTAPTQSSALRWATEHLGVKNWDRIAQSHQSPSPYGSAMRARFVGDGYMPEHPHPLVAHLRSPGPHVRGCHALDCILGRA